MSFPSCSPGSSPKNTPYAFLSHMLKFVLHCHCILKRNKIYKKRPSWAYFCKKKKVFYYFGRYTLKQEDFSYYKGRYITACSTFGHLLPIVPRETVKTSDACSNSSRCHSVAKLLKRSWTSLWPGDLTSQIESGQKNEGGSLMHSFGGL